MGSDDDAAPAGGADIADCSDAFGGGTDIADCPDAFLGGGGGGTDCPDAFGGGTDIADCPDAFLGGGGGGADCPDASGDDESWAFVWTGPVDGVDCPTFGGGPGGGPGGPRNAAPDSLATPRLELIKHPMVKNQKSNAHNIYIYILYIYIYKFLKIYINIYK